MSGNSISAHYIMRREPGAEVECGFQSGYPFLDFGLCFTILPTIEQLIQIRDAINACLETTEAQALMPVALRTVKKRVDPRLGLDVDNNSPVMRSGEDAEDSPAVMP